MTDPMKPHRRDEEKPPVFKSWRGWYALVLLHLAVLVILFYIITRAFR